MFIARKLVSPICGKPETLLVHLKACENITDIERKKYMDMKATDPPVPTAAGTKPRKEQSKLIVVSTPAWTEKLQKEFAADLCRVVVATGQSWNSIEHPEYVHFTNRWIPGAILPDRRILSGRILTEEVRKVEDRLVKRVQGKMGTGQCDGWKNIAKTALIACVVTVEYEVCESPCYKFSRAEKTLALRKRNIP
jgi:hypothetical protein